MRPGKGVRTGVLLDTMVVRPVLVPAFLILMMRRSAVKSVDAPCVVL